MVALEGRPSTGQAGIPFEVTRELSPASEVCKDSDYGVSPHPIAYARECLGPFLFQSLTFLQVKKTPAIEQAFGRICSNCCLVMGIHFSPGVKKPSRGG